MNWDEFCEFRTPDIAWAASRMNSNIYIGTLERILVEKEGELWSAESVFQHGNAIVHISDAKKRKHGSEGKILELLDQ